MALSDEVQRLHELRTAGALSEEQYTQAKRKLLNMPQAAAGPASETATVAALGEAVSGRPTQRGLGKFYVLAWSYTAVMIVATVVIVILAVATT